MNCFECAKRNKAVAAAGVCQHSGVALCLDHLIAAQSVRVGGTLYGSHSTLVGGPLRGMPAGIAASEPHHASVA